MLKKIVSDEKGRVLVWILLILGVGSLLLPPFLARISANLITSRAIEDGLKEQYAADSGVEYAMLQLKNRITQGSYSHTVNKKDVEVTWGEYITNTYKIASTATSQDGNSTAIESFIALDMYDYLWLLDNAITSLADVTVWPGTSISGKVQYGGELDNKGTIDPVPAGPEDDLDENWPPAEAMADFFYGDVEGLEEEAYGPGDVTIDLKDYASGLGPLLYIDDYIDPDDAATLEINNSGGPITVKLEGTIYVVGDLDFGQSGNAKRYTIDLNGHTIYVTEDIWFASNHVSITGSGCIIAGGSVTFQPGIDSNPDDFVFVMSVTEYVWMKPNGSFNGSVAGDTYVDLQPGSSITWTDWRGRDLNFPDGTTGNARIYTYKVYP